MPTLEIYLVQPAATEDLMTNAPSTWTLVFVPSPTSGDARRTPLAERVAMRAGLVLLGWAERRRESIRRSISLDRVADGRAVQRPFC
jgi:hypothetical protein